MAVQIFGHPDGITRFTSATKAAHYVAQGRVRQLDATRYEWIEDSPRHRAVVAIEHRQREYGTIASLRAIKGLPVAGDAMLLLIQRGKVRRAKQ